MGCDIHLAVERRDESGDWKDISSEAIIGYCGSWRDGTYDYDKSPSRRSYILFGFLADVRNGVGFAGVKTGEPIKPCFPRRGLPEDCNYDQDGHMKAGPKDANGDPDYDSDDYRSLGDHSFTYASLAELLAVPWDVVVNSTGILDEEVYRRWELAGRNGLPETWSGGVWGDNIKNVTEAQYLTLRTKANEPGDTPSEDLQKWLNRAANGGVRYAIECSWQWQPLIEAAFRKWVEWLGAKYPDHDRVRVLIGFDS